MSEPLQLFLACSFAKDKVDAGARPCELGYSDWDLAQIVKETIETASHGRLRVRITKDPFDNYIPSQVREDMAAADLMLCLFTRRTPIPNSPLWMTSSFVSSEGSAFLSQLPSEYETHGRLFGLAEEGVDHTQLGMAFPPGSKTVPRFQRMNIEGLKELAGQIVAQVLGRNTLPRDDREYLSLHKTVTILRDCRVRVETRHRFRFTTATRKVVIPHTIWRVSQPLAKVGDLLAAPHDPRKGLLSALSLDCGNSGQRNCKLRIVPGTYSGNRHEYRFEIEATGVDFKPGEELEYGIAWEYPRAFAVRSEYPNSIGLRCGERGTAQHASLTLQFERDLAEPDRVLEDSPNVFVTPVTEFRAGEDPEVFWHTSPSWKPLGPLAPCRKQCGVRYEVYRWDKDNFHGMAKVIFTPHLNYFQPVPDDANQVAPPVRKPGKGA